MQELLKRFESQPPEIVFCWKDQETEAEGWLVINSLRNGAAGGGTRMRPGLDLREVVSLAKTMEVKFTVSGPPIGGAKSGINFDPSDPRKKGVLERWYKAVIPILKAYYGTGGDLNIDEIHEVIPITESLGLWHPQEGVVNGLYGDNQGNKINKIGQLRFGVSKVVEDVRYTPNPMRKYTVADLITGYGVYESIKHYYELWNGDLPGKRAIIQGWGNVASAAAFYLAQSGVKIVGIIDRNGGVMDSDGFSFDEIRQFYSLKKGNTLSAPQLIPFSKINSEIWDLGAEIFVPAASSRLVSQSDVDRLVNKGLEVIACGANVPFADPEIFLGSIGEDADDRVAVIPDFIANCGMARVFAYLMGDQPDLSDEAIFLDTSNVIANALREIKYHCPKNSNLTREAFRIALNKLL